MSFCMRGLTVVLIVPITASDVPWVSIEIAAIIRKIIIFYHLVYQACLATCETDTPRIRRRRLGDRET